MFCLDCGSEKMHGYMIPVKKETNEKKENVPSNKLLGNIDFNSSEIIHLLNVLYYLFQILFLF